MDPKIVEIKLKNFDEFLDKVFKNKLTSPVFGVRQIPLGPDGDFFVQINSSLYNNSYLFDEETIQSFYVGLTHKGSGVFCSEKFSCSVESDWKICFSQAWASFIKDFGAFKKALNLFENEVYAPAPAAHMTLESFFTEVLEFFGDIIKDFTFQDQRASALQGPFTDRVEYILEGSSFMIMLQKMMSPNKDGAYYVKIAPRSENIHRGHAGVFAETIGAAFTKSKARLLNLINHRQKEQTEALGMLDQVGEE
jgi:hypothetical protein